MKTVGYPTRYRGMTLVAAAVSLILASCAGAPLKSTAAADARAKLTALQSDPNLANRAPAAFKDAEAAVITAETSRADQEQVQHLAYLADRKVDTARARAEISFAEDQRVKLGEQRETVRLDARTREADAAKNQAVMARNDADAAKNSADAARNDASAARTEAATAQAETMEQQRQAEVARTDADAARAAAMQQADSAAQNASELQRQIDELQAKKTDRGLVLTLGDVLFTTGKSNLNAGATGSLDKLTAFLNHYPERSAVIEGHTDNLGSESYNQDLSQRRADSVKGYLMGHGITGTRLVAAGKGEEQPLAENDSATGRQQNRRVEVIIDNPTTMR